MWVVRTDCGKTMLIECVTRSGAMVFARKLGFTATETYLAAPGHIRLFELMNVPAFKAKFNSTIGDSAI